MIRILPCSEAGRLLNRRAQRLAQVEAAVQPIIEDVRKRGDKALLEYVRKLDGLDRSSISVKPKELEAAYSRLSEELKTAAQAAIANIRRYAQYQMPEEGVRTFAPGMRLGQIVRPLGTVAAYVPGGRYPLPSTLLMTAVPAQVAGVPRICICTPRPSDAVLGMAHTLGVSEVFLMGGAHAIAAFAFGTKTVPQAERIVGPGNAYVAAAKKLLAGEVGIDFIAGPTEILIIAREGSPRHLAADMLAQAEHDPQASAILLTTSRKLAESVAQQIEMQLRDLPTAAVARKAIDGSSAIIIVSSMEEAIDVSNQFAPEHLSLPDNALLEKVTNAGSVFVGPSSPEAAGDYACGPNHVLPTNGSARLRGGLSVRDFLKVISVQELSASALSRLAPTITTLARAEGLEAHARSVEIRVGG